MLENTVIAVIAREKKYPLEMISLESNLEEIGIDSLEAISILYELEKELDVDIPNDSISAIATVGDIVEKLKQLVAVRTK
jgi:acyl carrier protein